MVLVPDDHWTGNSHSLDFQAMGTSCRVLFSADSTAAASRFKDSVVAWVSGFEARYSRFRPESIISRINANAGLAPVTIDDELRSILTVCDWYYWATKGIFDPTALPLVQLWDYRSGNRVVPSDDKVKEAVALTGWKKMERQGDKVFLPVAGMGIDLGGMGKEYAIDRVMEMAVAAGVENIMVDFGRDIRVHGVPPQRGQWRIGLEDPVDPGKCWAGIGISDRAIATSGDYRRNFVVDGKCYGHIIDPRTGYPVSNDCKAVSVIAPTCTEAGVIARTVFVMGPEEGMPFMESFVQAEGSIITGNCRFESPGFCGYVIDGSRAGQRQKESIA